MTVQKKRNIAQSTFNMKLRSQGFILAQKKQVVSSAVMDFSAALSDRTMTKNILWQYAIIIILSDIV